MSAYHYVIFGGNVNIDSISDFLSEIIDYANKNNLLIQLFNADMIYEKTHLESAIIHAIRAEENNMMSTNSIEMEILLYASGDRQLKYAIPKMGINTGNNRTAIVLLTTKSKIDFNESFVLDFCNRFQINRNDSVIDGSIDKLKNFGIKPNQYDQYEKEQYLDIILEKIAMVDIIK